LRVSALAVALSLWSTAAHADPVSAAVAVWTAVKTAAVWIAGKSLLAAAVRTIGMSLLAQALQKKPKPAQAAGIKAQTSTGGATPQSFILGIRATGGQTVAPLYSYGSDGGTPNAYLVYIIERGVVPGQTTRRMVINDAYVEIGALTTIGGSTVQGHALGGIYAGNAWVRFHDGDQTAADELLVQKLSDYPDRPWSSDMIGKRRPYAVLVFKYNREVLNSPPTVRFEEDSIPLYDPRYDSSVGGSGPQRWGQPETYVPSDNLVVIIYNIHRGITLPCGSIWGGEATADDLPFDNWVAAMNDCDEVEDLPGGLTEARYRGGIEVSVTDEPADVIEALENACQAQQVEIGGVWKIRIGGPGLPVMFITDEDVLIDHDRTHDMFPSLGDTKNGIHATWVNPEALWETTEAPPIYNEDWEAEDGGRRLVADLPLPVVFSQTQAQRIMESAIKEERRFRRHGLTLGPYASMLEPLDSIAWTSAAEGYTSKIFEISETTQILRTLNITVSIRERDSGDFTPPEIYLPSPPVTPGTGLPVVQAVPGFTVTAGSIADGAGVARKPAIILTWDGDELVDVRGLIYEVALAATGFVVTAGTHADITTNGLIISEGIVSLTNYLVRARLVVDRPTDWTSWVPVTTLYVANNADTLNDLPGLDIINGMNTSLEEALKATLSAEMLRQYMDAKLYDGAGRDVIYRVLQAEEKADGVFSRLNMIGVLLPDGSAFVLDLTKVMVAPDKSLAQYISGVEADLEDNQTGLQGQADAFQELKATVEDTDTGLEAIGELVAGVSASVGNITAGGLLAFQAVAVEGGGDVVSRIVIRSRATVSDAWVEVGTIWEAGFVGGNPAMPFSRQVNYADQTVWAKPDGSRVPLFIFDTVDGIFKAANLSVAGAMYVRGPEGQVTTLRQRGYQIDLDPVTMASTTVPDTSDVRTYSTNVSGTAGYRLALELFHNREDQPIDRRIASGEIKYRSTSTASVDTAFSTWLQVLNADKTAVLIPRTLIGNGVDSGGGKGTVTATGGGKFIMPDNGVLQIYVSVRNRAGNYQPGGDNDYSISECNVGIDVSNW
jgi:hypothetical protein